MYTKEMLITDPERSGKRVKAVVRNYVTADFEELIRIQAESFPPPYPEELLWSHEHHQSCTALPGGCHLY